MPRGEYIDWETERDGMPLWEWCRDRHANGWSWAQVSNAVGYERSTVRKAVQAKERALFDSSKMPWPKEQDDELPKTLPLRDAARAARQPDLSGIHPPVPVEPTEPVVQVIEHPGGIADGEHLIATQLSAQQRGIELLRTWREEDKAHSTLVDAYRDAQSEQRIAMLNELLDIERGAENEAWEVTAPERTVALPEDLARDALIAYAWVSAKPSRWDRAHDSRDAVETAEAMLRERAA